MISRGSGGVSDVVHVVLGIGDLLSWACHRTPVFVRVVQALAAGVATSAKKVSIYDGIESDLLRRGETLFPFTCFDEPRDWKAIGRAMDRFTGGGDRFMTPDEILKLYD
jgi:hypothetical protein